MWETTIWYKVVYGSLILFQILAALDYLSRESLVMGDFSAKDIAYTATGYKISKSIRYCKNLIFNLLQWI